MRAPAPHRTIIVLTGVSLILAGCAQPLGPVAPESQTKVDIFENFDPPAARLTKSPSESWVEAGTRLLAGGDAPLAELAFIRAINDEGVTAEALTGVAIAAEQQGQVNKAVKYFREARKRVPESVLANNNLGVALYRQGEYHGAKQAFQAAFALSSGTSGIAAHNLGLAEAALIAKAESDRSELPPKDDLVRLGSGSYRLVIKDDPLQTATE